MQSKILPNFFIWSWSDFLREKLWSRSNFLHPLWMSFIFFYSFRSWSHVKVSLSLRHFLIHILTFTLFKIYFLFLYTFQSHPPSLTHSRESNLFLLNILVTSHHIILLYKVLYPLSLSLTLRSLHFFFLTFFLFLFLWHYLTFTISLWSTRFSIKNFVSFQALYHCSLSLVRNLFTTNLLLIFTENYNLKLHK